MTKKAFITGITGQTGSYLAELLLERGYSVTGFIRRTSNPLMDNIKHIEPHLQLVKGCMTDAVSIQNVLRTVQPDEIYNLAGMSQVRWSFDIPLSTLDINTLGFARIIEAVRGMQMDCKIYQAGSSEMFGKVLQTPQNEHTPFNPQSPYGVSKAAAFYLAKVYREAYGMKIYNGILFNHESPRRGCEFLSRKVCKAVADIAVGAVDHVTLGNLDAKRDFGFAKEYAAWIYRIVQHDTPDDFVIATGETHSVQEFVERAFAAAGISDWRSHVRFDEALMRPAEVNLLLGDTTKARSVLGFVPRVTFDELVRLMVDHELSSRRRATAAV